MTTSATRHRDSSMHIFQYVARVSGLYQNNTSVTLYFENLSALSVLQTRFSQRREYDTVPPSVKSHLQLHPAIIKLFCLSPSVSVSIFKSLYF